MGDNQYSEKWTLEECERFMLEAVKISEQPDMDFIGEVAREQQSYKEVYIYITDKFKALKPLLKRLKSNCERNCFSNGKNGAIVPSLAIMNLKSNHGWTDRVDNTTKGDKIESQPAIVFKKFNGDESTE